METQVIGPQTSGFQDQNYLEYLKQGMDRVLTDMAAGSVSNGAQVGARSQMESLFGDVMGLAQQTNQEQQQQHQAMLHHQHLVQPTCGQNPVASMMAAAQQASNLMGIPVAAGPIMMSPSVARSIPMTPIASPHRPSVVQQLQFGVEDAHPHMLDGNTFSALTSVPGVGGQHRAS